jgi:hypothetical protein
VRIGNHQLLCTSSTDVQQHLNVNVLIRPTASRLIPMPNGWRGHELETGEDIEAAVVDVAYRGRGYDHVVDCAYGRLVSVFDVRAWPLGTRCLLRIDPDGCRAFPSESRQAVPNSC